MRGAEQEVVEPQPGVAPPAIALVVPESVDRLVRVQVRSASVQPCFEQAPERGAACGLQQRVVVPRLGRIDVGVGRHDVVVAGQHHGQRCWPERGGVGDQALEPGELVVEFRAGLRIAVRQVDGADQDAVDSGLDVAALPVRAGRRAARAA